jgi:hypothetical protein
MARSTITLVVGDAAVTLGDASTALTNVSVKPSCLSSVEFGSVRFLLASRRGGAEIR